MSNNENTALERVDPATLGLPPDPITDINEARNALTHAANKHCNLLAPLTKLNYLPESYQMVIRTVFAPPLKQGNRKKGDSNGYWWVTENGKPALTRASLDQLAQAAGITDVDSRIDCPEPYLWICTHTIAMRDLDGRERRVTRSKEVDLRDGAPLTQGKSDRNVKRAREHGAQVCQSKAANRCIRAALGVKGSYEWDESEKPFVFPVLQFVPNMADPMIARMVAAKELGVIDNLFGAQAVAEIAHDRGEVMDTTAIPAPIGRQIEGQPEPQGDNDDPAGEEPAPRGPPTCVDCGMQIARKTASRTLTQHGDFYCEDHEPEGGGRSWPRSAARSCR